MWINSTSLRIIGFILLVTGLGFVSWGFYLRNAWFICLSIVFMIAGVICMANNIDKAARIESAENRPLVLKNIQHV